MQGFCFSDFGVVLHDFELFDFFLSVGFNGNIEKKLNVKKYFDFFLD